MFCSGIFGYGPPLRRATEVLSRSVHWSRPARSRNLTGHVKPCMPAAAVRRRSCSRQSEIFGCSDNPSERRRASAILKSNRRLAIAKAGHGSRAGHGKHKIHLIATPADPRQCAQDVNRHIQIRKNAAELTTMRGTECRIRLRHAPFKEARRAFSSWHGLNQSSNLNDLPKSGKVGHAIVPYNHQAFYGKCPTKRSPEKEGRHVAMTRSTGRDQQRRLP